MILAAHQPQFLPWLGYFHKMAKCDLFVFLDDVQFKKNEWQNRNRIWSRDGGQWLTVPVLHHFPQTIREVRVNNESNWRDKHRKSLSQTYSHAPYFHGMWEPWEKMYNQSWDHLVEISIYSIETLRGMLNVETKTVLSSTLGVEGESTQRLVNLCRRMKADTYLAGAGGRDYMQMDLFEQAGIRVLFQDFQHPSYEQFGKMFVPHLTALDSVFLLGSQAQGLLR